LICLSFLSMSLGQKQVSKYEKIIINYSSDDIILYLLSLIFVCLFVSFWAASISLEGDNKERITGRSRVYTGKIGCRVYIVESARKYDGVTNSFCGFSSPCTMTFLFVCSVGQVMWSRESMTETTIE
jgi:hypothetical protein